MAPKPKAAAKGGGEFGTVDPTNLQQGTVVWVPDPENDQVWARGEVVSLGKTAAKVSVNDVVRDVLLTERMFLCNAEMWSGKGLVGVTELSTLMHLHEPEVLQTLQVRFDVDEIYTFCGPILIAVNPFKAIPGMYGQKSLDAVEGGGPNLPPHIYSISSRALADLARNHTSQVVLISGESGAGKTETTKHVLKYMSEKLQSIAVTPVARKTLASKARKTEAEKEEPSTEEKILQSNPLLEAFGNACTVRNSNSSRFGKFIELKFNEVSGKLNFVGAMIDTYLLEKVRVTELTGRERSYHIFYQACAALEKFGPNGLGMPLEYFGPAESFTYLAKSSIVKLERVDDGADFEEMQQAMTALQISVEEQTSIVKVIAAVLHSGNIAFEGTEEDCDIASGNKSFKLVSKLLQIDEEVVRKSLTHRLISVSKTERYAKPLGIKQSVERAQALTRVIYGAVFNFLVSKVNDTLCAVGVCRSGNVFMGVLDIFGFEDFTVNSFEQLCINLANERLQKFFNDFVFRLEMDLYKSEGVSCDASDYPDNQEIIDLVQGKGSSILVLLDEECRLPKGSDSNFISKVRQTFAKHARFMASPKAQSTFTIIHFAGKVTYESARFLDKNIDELGDLLKAALDSAQEPFVQKLLNFVGDGKKRNSVDAGGRGKLKPRTVSLEFRSQLDSLMTTIAEARPHFVRCLKPNPLNKPNIVNRQTVVDQLRSGGVIEALRVQRAGYPCRVPCEACWHDMKLLLPAEVISGCGVMDLNKKLDKMLSYLQKSLPLPSSANGTCFAIGKTTVFFKQAPFEKLEAAKLVKLNKAAVRIQSYYKMYRLSGVYQFIRASTILIQSHQRRFHVRKRTWDEFSPRHRTMSRLFGGPGIPREPSVRFMEETDDEDGKQNEEDTSAAERDAESQKLEDERRLEDELAAAREAEAQLKAEEEARRNAEEEARRKAEEEARRRAEEDARRKAEEEMRHRAEEEARKRAEEEAARQRLIEEERNRLKGEMRRLEDELHAAKENGERLESARQQLKNSEEQTRKIQGELDFVKKDHEARKVEFESQVKLISCNEERLRARILELERENDRLAQDLTAEVGNSAMRMSSLQVAHDQALTQERARHEESRETAAKRLEELRTAMTDSHNSQMALMRERLAEAEGRFQEHLTNLQKNKADISLKHDQELASIQGREVEQQRKFQGEFIQMEKSVSDLSLERQVLEHQMKEMRMVHEEHTSTLVSQLEEVRRSGALQLEMKEAEMVEHERAKRAELEVVTKQRDDQAETFNSQMKSQREDLVARAAEELEFVKRQFAQRENSLMQLLERSREGHTENQKTTEMQLALKGQQQDELQRCSDMRAQHLEDSAKRQQELYEAHIDQLSTTLRKNKEAFEQQLKERELQADMHLREVTSRYASLESQFSVDSHEQERVMKSLRQEVEERAEEESRRQTERIEALAKEASGLRRELSTTQEQLSVAKRNPAPAPKPERRCLDKCVSTEDLGEEEQKKLSVRRLMLPRLSVSPESPTPDDASRTSQSPLKTSTRTSVRNSVRPSIRGSIRGSRLSVRGGGNMNFARRLLGSVLGEEAPSRPTDDGPLALSKAIGSEFLRPSLRQQGKDLEGPVGWWRAVQVDSAATCICFAKSVGEKVPLAVACQSGSISVFHVWRTPMERNIPAGAAKSQEDGPEPEAMLRFQGHSKAVTMMCFSPNGEQLVSASSDWTVKIWSLEGALIDEIVETSLVSCVLPLSRPALVLSTEGNILRLCGRGVGQEIQQKVRLDNYARSLAIDEDQTRLLAGGGRGTIMAFHVGEDGLKMVSKMQFGHAAITCILFVPCNDGTPPIVVANATDSTVCVLQSNDLLTSFTVLRRIPNPHKMLPLRSCHVPSPNSPGFVVSGGEDLPVRVFDMDAFTEHQLTAHTAPVVAAAVSSQNTLLASGDVRGRIILWRRGGNSTGSPPSNPSSPRSPTRSSSLKRPSVSPSRPSIGSQVLADFRG
mmetsp:Transcript_36271/g.96405  ORF Transcript_36271/g.96405 Transcript_36271/m.96405 type:complete len:1978 (-) Transcript_36271:181-6114(-)